MDKIPCELWKGYAPNLNFLIVLGCLAKVPLPEFKWGNNGSKTFDSMFIGYAQTSVAYRFMSLYHFSINKSMDAKFCKHVFLLKDNVSTPVQVNLPVYDNVHMSTSSYVISNFVNEPTSMRCRIETSFGPNLFTNLLIEDFYVNFLFDELVYDFSVKKDPKNYGQVMRSTNVSF